MAFSTDLIAEEIKWNNITQGTWHKEDVRHKCITRKAKASVRKQAGR